MVRVIPANPQGIFYHIQFQQGDSDWNEVDDLSWTALLFVIQVERSPVRSVHTLQGLKLEITHLLENITV